MRGRSRSIISSVISGKSRSRNGCCAARSSAIASPGTRSWTWDSSQGSMKGSFSFRKARSYWTSPRGIEASSSPRPARNSFDESRSSPWTRGSHAGSGCTRGSRSDSDSGKSTAGPPPRRRVFLKSRNTSESVLNDPAAEVPFPVCLTLKYGPDRYLPTREATRLSGVRARGGSGSVGPETRVAPASQSDRSSGHGRDQPTKIAVAAPEFGRIWGGIGTYLGQLLPGIASHHEVTILCGQTPTYDTGYQTVPLADGGGIMANYFKFQRALQRRWPDLVREYRPDLLVVHHAQMPDLWTDSMPCPTVVTTHTTILGQARGIQGALRHGGPLDDTERTTLAVLPALLPIELYYWNRVRHVLFVSDAVRQEGLGTYGPRVRTSALIPNGLALPSYMESCPYSLIEAMAFEKPVVATAIPGTMSMVEDGVSALLVPPGDALALAEGIDRLLGDEGLRRRLGRTAAIVARDRFSSERMCAETLQYFERVLAAS